MRVGSVTVRGSPLTICHLESASDMLIPPVDVGLRGGVSDSLQVPFRGVLLNTQILKKTVALLFLKVGCLQ